MKTYNIKTAPTEILKKFYDKTIKSNSFARFFSIPIKKELNKRKNIKPQTVNTIVPKSKPIKYASIGRKQMRMGRSGTVVTSSGLLVNKNMKIKKKKLLGE